MKAAYPAEPSIAQAITVVLDMAELLQRMSTALTAAAEAEAGMAAAREPEIREVEADPLISQVTQDVP